MKRLFYYSVAVALSFLFLSSCNKLEDDFAKADFQDFQDFELVKLSDFVDSSVSLRSAFQEREIEDQMVIRFKDELAYEQTIEQLQDKSKGQQLAWTRNVRGFISLREIFEQAMKDIDDVDETEATYLAFMKKYEKYLYFPLFKEDAGVYMPIAELELTAIASPDGYVIIGNEVKNLKNINSYADLQATGQAYYSLNPVSSNEVSTRNWQPGMPLFSNTSQFIGNEEVIPWEKNAAGDRQIQFKLGRLSNKKNINPIGCCTPGFQFRINLKLEISFRKSSIFGWVNYSGDTDSTIKLTAGNSTHTHPHKETNTFSSHDWKSPDLLYSTTGQYHLSKPLFSVPAVTAVITTAFSGFPNVLVKNFFLPVAYFIES
jgi:hypothetical protein